MLLHDYKLPTKEGYVEDISDKGKRMYKEIENNLIENTKGNKKISPIVQIEKEDT